MALTCPGKDKNAVLESVLLPCPRCGKMNEVFGDEQRVHCCCGQWVCRDAVPSCAQWCQAAEQCLGKAGALAGRKRKSADKPPSPEEQGQ